MQNKARLSEMTAFSFCLHLEPFMIRQISLIYSFIVIGITPRITTQNEILKNTLILLLMPSEITKQWQHSQKGGIVLSRLLVSI